MSSATGNCNMPLELEKWQLRIIVHEVIDIVYWNIFPSPFVTFHEVTEEKRFGIFKKTKLLGGTDIHKKCVKGHALFNYRFVRDGEGSLPVMQLRLMEENRYTHHNFLGSLTLDFTAIPEPERTDRGLTRVFFKREHQYINLVYHQNGKAYFQRTVSGFWPMKARKTYCGERYVAGKTHLTIQLLTEKEAQNNPVLRGCPDEDEETNAKPMLICPERLHGSYKKHFFSNMYNYWNRTSPATKFMVAFLFIIVQELLVIIFNCISFRPTFYFVLDYSIVMIFNMFTFFIIYVNMAICSKKRYWCFNRKREDTKITS